MSRLLALAVMAVLMTVLVIGPAFAQEEVTPGSGSASGEHVSSMAPEHPKAAGSEFGKCVSTMARTGFCPHG